MRAINAMLSTMGAGAVSLVAATVAFAQDKQVGPEPGGWFFQEAATPVMTDLIWVHNMVQIIITAIVIFVVVLMGYICIRFRESKNPVPSKTSHNTLIEIIWTVVPVILLVIIAIPSMNLLYKQDRLPETEMTVKVVGNTWNWLYSYPDYENVEEWVSSPLDKTQAETVGQPYLLATDAPLVVPVGTKVKVLVTSVNNMHSWAMPSFGVKMDAVPGIINETWFEVYEEGTYYGQCSEICGINHYYMPIEVKVVSKAEFARFIAAGGEPADKFAALNIDDANGGAAIIAANE
ncbi:putative cytochrome c oxidase subunit 2 [Algimonas arctica]|uniref:Cytochrome c oxidase subunit 2 n=1 Tax=Algimonas arctica TaxID=1479486 RepID=A0A8J3G3P1_9PROT|nr:cytochrome c oxidase subunit II [Algimonas arctica]GHB04352.1 putative cytochrome c oxidase subunit 2 [Algimonas arctica]